MSRSNIVQAEAQDMYLTKRALAQLQKDDFEVCTRQLRNGVKFYQDKDLIEAFIKNPDQSNKAHVTVKDVPNKSVLPKSNDRAKK